MEAGKTKLSDQIIKAGSGGCHDPGAQILMFPMRTVNKSNAQPARPAAPVPVCLPRTR